ncbi:MAG: RecB family exonuclease [Candidatus Aquicultorales bacterium]
MDAATGQTTPDLSDRTVYSHSRLSTFEQCARKYRYRYIDKVLPVTVSVEAFMGSLVHESLEELYGRVKDGETPCVLKLIDGHSDRWSRKWHEGITINKREYSERDYYIKSAQSLKRYFSRYEPFNEAEVLDTELEIVFPLDAAGDCMMRGIIDRLDRRPDGTIEIHDYKCSGYLPSVYKLTHDRQLPLYHIAVLSWIGEAAEVELVWHYLLFDREIRIKKTPAQLELTKRRCLETIWQIEEETAFEKTRSKLCNWCEYQEVCK